MGQFDIPSRQLVGLKWIRIWKISAAAPLVFVSVSVCQILEALCGGRSVRLPLHQQYLYLTVTVQ